MIPCTHNHAGFPGRDQRRRADRPNEGAGAALRRGDRRGLRQPGRAAAKAVSRPNGDCGPVAAKTVLLATGVTNRRPPMDEAAARRRACRGLIRYCPICDGYEVTDKQIAVIGTGDKAASRRRCFLRSFTADLTLIAPDGEHELSDEDRASLTEAGVNDRRRAGARQSSRMRTDCIVVDRPSAIRFDSVYPALGSRHPHPARRNARRAARTRTAASASTRISAPACPASTRRATSSSASTRSAMRWAKAGSPRPPSATIWRRRARSGARRGIPGRGRSARRRSRRFPGETGSASAAVRAFPSRAGRPRRNSRPRATVPTGAPAWSKQGSPMMSA